MQSNAGERPLFKRACVDVEARAENQSINQLGGRIQQRVDAMRANLFVWSRSFEETHLPVVHHRAIEELFLKEHSGELAVLAGRARDGDHVRVSSRVVVPVDGNARLPVHVDARAPVRSKQDEEGNERGGRFAAVSPTDDVRAEL